VREREAETIEHTKQQREVYNQLVVWYKRKEIFSLEKRSTNITNKLGK